MRYIFSFICLIMVLITKWIFINLGYLFYSIGLTIINLKSNDIYKKINFSTEFIFNGKLDYVFAILFPLIFTGFNYMFYMDTEGNLLFGSVIWNMTVGNIFVLLITVLISILFTLPGTEERYIYYRNYIDYLTYNKKYFNTINELEKYKIEQIGTIEEWDE